MPSSKHRSAPKPAQRNVSNLETDGDRLKVYSLQTLLTNKRNPRTRDVARLGDVLIPWFKQSVVKPGEKLQGTVELWQRLVPARFSERVRIVGLRRGVLTVGLPSAAMRAEFDILLRSGLLRTFQLESRGAIFRIKTCVQPLLPQV